MGSQELVAEVAAETDTDQRTVRKVLLQYVLGEEVSGKSALRIVKALKRRKVKPKFS